MATQDDNPLIDVDELPDAGSGTGIHVDSGACAGKVVIRPKAGLAGELRHDRRNANQQ
ncbi:hypothetical protein LWF01_13685 [Saxibacter everestensis]|uniref:Uncharacterized protein n=1 Tax=Saxibacter everestensis TaxID=2909229 RepID=A0ABY8QQ79_9MICO|nr:hypothetical protein LWF01_13685 [Brevibacteriaceae bacterium ZFBP1038]